nr:hypothetical protein Iba_chr02bCG15610 [Ipomoea batatas]
MSTAVNGQGCNSSADRGSSTDGDGITFCVPDDEQQQRAAALISSSVSDKPSNGNGRTELWRASPLLPASSPPSTVAAASSTLSSNDRRQRQNKVAAFKWRSTLAAPTPPSPSSVRPSGSCSGEAERRPPFRYYVRKQKR